MEIKLDIMRYLLICHPFMIIAIANSKGGVGKSTLAVHLAAWLHEQGHRVTLADCDTQQSSSEWIREAVPDVKAVRLDNPDIILNDLPILNQDADYRRRRRTRQPDRNQPGTVAPRRSGDRALQSQHAGSPGAGQGDRSAPPGPGHPGGKPNAVIVLSMVGKNYRLTQDMKDAAAALNLPLASNAMTLRQIYADAPGQGAVVWDMGTRARDAADGSRPAVPRNPARRLQQEDEESRTAPRRKPRSVKEEAWPNAAHSSKD